MYSGGHVKPKSRAGRKPSFDRLTPHQINVLELVVQGLSNEEIALQLGIKARTVKFHLHSIYRKRGIDNRTKLVLLELESRKPKIDSSLLPLPVGRIA